MGRGATRGHRDKEMCKRPVGIADVGRARAADSVYEETTSWELQRLILSGSALEGSTL